MGLSPCLMAHWAAQVLVEIFRKLDVKKLDVKTHELKEQMSLSMILARLLSYST